MLRSSGSDRRAPLGRLLSALVIAVPLLVCACSSSAEHRVVVVDGTTTTAPTTTLVPSAEVDPDLGEPTLTTSSTVTTAGIGDLRFGMTLEEAQQALGTLLEPEGEGDTDCFVVVPREAPDGISFLVVEAQVERVDVTSDEIRTPSGAGVGMVEDELRELFPERLQATPIEGGNRFTFVPNDPGEARFRIVFETDGDRVVTYRAGRLPHVEGAGC